MVRERERTAPPDGDLTRAVLEATIAALPALFRADGCAVLLPSNERAGLRGVARRGLSEPQVEALAQLLMHREVAELLADGRPFLPRDAGGVSSELQGRLRADGWPDLLAAPLPGTGRPVGALVIVPEGEGRWQPARIEAAVQAGALVAVALRAAVRATEGERRRRRAATLLERLPLVADRTVSREDALGRIVAGAGDALGVTHCLGVLWPPVDGFVEYCQPGVTPVGPPRAPERHPMWPLLRMGGLWSYEDAEASPADRSQTGSLLGGLHPRAALAVPVRPGGTLAGFLLLLQADRRRRFSDEERQFAHAAAQELAGLLESPFEGTQTAEEIEVSPLLAAQSAMAEATTADEVSRALHAALSTQTAPIDAVLLARYDDAARRLLLLGGVAGGETLADGDLPPAPLGDDLVSEVVREGRAAGGAGSRGLPRPWRTRYRPLRAAHALALPASGGREHSCVVLAIGPEEAVVAAAPVLRALAPSVGLSLSRASLVEQASRRERRLAALNDVLLATSSAPDVTTACAEAAAAIDRDLPDVDLVNVWMLEEDGAEVQRISTTSTALSADQISERLAVESDTGVGRVIQRRSTDVWQRSDARLPAAVREFMERTEVQTLAIVPMRTVRGVSGALSLGSLRGRRYNGEELTFLEALAGQLGAQLELVQARERAEAERRRLLSLVETLPEGLMVVDADGRVDLYNPTAERLLAMSVRDRDIAELFAEAGARLPDGRPFAREELPMLRALAGETVIGAELVIGRADGPQTPLLVNCRPVQDPQGQSVGAICVFQDLSPLQELSSLKSDFVNTVSHELRTPITTIRGGALTLLKRRQFLDEQTQGELLNDIAEEAERLHLLVEDLLSLTRSRSGMNVQPEPVLIGRLINRVILESGGRVGGHALLVNVPADLPPVDADPALTEKVVRNLLENAVKFSPRGQQIEVSAESVDGTVIVSVLDRGSGVPAADIDRVFEPFYRPDETVRSGAQGAGLGLAVCRRLVELQGGRIWAESRAGGGAAFRFTLPVAEADE